MVPGGRGGDEWPRGSGAARPRGAKAAAWPGRASARAPAIRLPDAGAWLRRCLVEEVENRRLLPWLAVVFGTGVLSGFAADGPLSPWPPLLLGMAAGAAAVALRARFLVFCGLVAVAAWAFGFLATAVRIRTVDAPRLERLAIATLGGFVESVEERQRGGGRLVVRPATLEATAGLATSPTRIRVTLRDLAGIGPGDYVTGRVRILPPPEAARPGGYDFARDAYFRGIGAVGSFVGAAKRLDPPPHAADASLRLGAAIDRARNALTSRIAGTIGGQAGAVAAALVTGKRGLIDERTNDVLRAAGIYHIVSISGLHMVLAAGTFFWLARALLALSPALALHRPIKKIAALVGMAGATAYCVFSGADVATERSLIMILVMQGAILFDRPALSLRNLALSAIIVLAREPDSLLGPSFQMSYAAVAGLIALAEWQRGRHGEDQPSDLLSRVGRWLLVATLGTIATTLVASVVTGPFSAYHFQNLQPYGLIGNAATLPLVSLAVMPAAVLGVLAYPFGLDRPVWWLMGLAVEAVLKLSAWVAGLGGSTLTVPAFGMGALGCLVLAILCATLFVSGLRRLAWIPAMLGLGLAWTSPRPDIYVARDGSGAAVRGPDGRLTLVGRVQAFTVAQWLKADGDARAPDDPSLKAAARCDRVGCTVAMAGGRRVSYLTDRRGFETDCDRSPLVMARITAPAGCAAPHLVDRAFLAGHGATSLRVKAEGGFAIDTVRRPGETRAWLPQGRPSASAPSRETKERARMPQAGQDSPPARQAEPELTPLDPSDSESSP